MFHQGSRSNFYTTQLQRINWFRSLQTKPFLLILGSFKILQRSSMELKYTELHDTLVAIIDNAI